MIASIPVGPWTWEPTTAQIAGASAIPVLSAVNYVGTKEGATVQGSLSAIKLQSLAGLIVLGLHRAFSSRANCTSLRPFRA